MPKRADVSGHWSQLIEGLQASSQDFYTRLEAAIQSRGLSDSRTSRIHWREGGALSAKREYLRVRRKKIVFDVCAAPYGNGFFVSWWSGDLRTFMDALRDMPLLGAFLIAMRPMTYYKADTEIMFRTSVHLAVQEVVDGLTKAQGLRALSEAERRPVLKDLFER